MPYGRQLSTLVASMLLLSSITVVRADDEACKAVLDALGKQATTPVRLKVSIESAAAPGKLLLSEVVRVEGTMYMQVAGQWVKQPYDGAMVANDARKAMEKTPHTCSRLRTEDVEGQPAELYSVQSKSLQGTTDSQIWISDADGLPLRQHTEMHAGTGSNRHDVRFDYKNVKAPQ